MKNKARFIVSLLFLFLGTFLGTSAYPHSYALRGLSVSDGLSDLLVNAIYKDRAGYVWLGTGSSLERFDGVHIRHYRIAGDNEKLKRVNAIIELPDGQLWMGNGMGLWRLNREQDTLERIAPELIDCTAYSFLSRGDTLYIGSEKGLFVYNRGNFKQILPERNVFAAGNSVTGLCGAEQPDMLWLVTKDGLYALQLSTERATPYHNVMDSKHICSFNNLVRIGGMLYLGTMNQGIISFDTRSHRFAHAVDVGCNVISSLSTDGKGMLYVGTDGNGVHFIDTRRQEVVRSIRHESGNDESLRSNSVYSLLVDREGVIWVGFYQLGLDYTLYQTDLFTTYAFPPFFDSKDMPIRAIAIRGREKLIGSRDGLFYIDEEHRRFKSFRVPEMRSGMIFCTLYYRGEYYVGTYGGGMYIFNPQTLTLREFEPDEAAPFQKKHIFCIKRDGEDRLWIGTSQGIYCYKDGRLEAHYTSSNSKLPEGNVYEIYFDSTRKGWICTENGLCIYDPSTRTLRTDVFPEGFIHREKVRVIYEDSAHRLYFFPDKGSLCISDLSMNSFRRLQAGTPLEGRDGLFIIEDREGWLWLGTANGLFRYDKKENFVPYSFVDGIPSPVFTLCPPVRDEAGDYWLGNSKGLLKLDVARMRRKRQNPYPMRVTEVQVNGRPSVHPIVRGEAEGGGQQSVHPVVQGEQKISLESSQQNVTFFFSDFSYTSPGFMAYEYQLEGEDENWVAVTGRSDVTYYNLPSGSYVFRVRRMGEPDSETHLTVEIASAFSLWTAAGVVALLLLGGGGGYLVYRRGRKRASASLMPHAVASNTSASDAKPTASEDKYKTYKVSADECRHLAEKLEAIMRRDKPYTNPELKIADLAVAMGTSAHTLSYLFNQHLNRNYYDYINDYRIAEFKRLANKDESARYTLGALAELCGFSSRASFFRYFKKATGITPNEYIRSIGRENE